MNNERGKGPQQIGEALGDLERAVGILEPLLEAFSWQ